MDNSEYRDEVLEKYDNAVGQLDLESSIWLVGMVVKHYQASNRNDIVRVYLKVCNEMMLQKQNIDQPYSMVLEWGMIEELNSINYDEDSEFYQTAGGYFLDFADEYDMDIIADPVMRNVVFELAKISQMPDGIEKESMRKAVCELAEAIDDTPKIDDFWRL